MMDPLKIVDFNPSRDRQKLLREQEVLDQVSGVENGGSAETKLEASCFFHSISCRVSKHISSFHIRNVTSA